MATTPHVYEEAARARKAVRLADTAIRLGATALEVATNPDLRAKLVTVAGTHPPSPHTWQLVVALLDDQRPGKPAAPRPVAPVNVGALVD